MLQLVCLSNHENHDDLTEMDWFIDYCRRRKRHRADIIERASASVEGASSSCTKDEATATAFTLDVDGREYLITAKHVVKGLQAQDRIDILKNDGWTAFRVDIFLCDDPIDIAVTVPSYPLTGNQELSATNLSYALGQEAYFAGFPYGTETGSA